jgi:hypothetical protein
MPDCLKSFHGFIITVYAMLYLAGGNDLSIPAYRESLQSGNRLLTVCYCSKTVKNYFPVAPWRSEKQFYCRFLGRYIV